MKPVSPLLSQKGDLRYTLCTKQHLPDVMRFIDEHWRKDHVLSRNQELLCWQFNSTPLGIADVAAAIILACEGDNLIGMQGLIPTSFHVYGDVHDGLWLANLKVRDDKISTGAGMHLMSASHKLQRPILAVSGVNEKVQTMFRIMKYHTWSDAQRWLGVIDTEKTAQLMNCEPSTLQPWIWQSETKISDTPFSLSKNFSAYRNSWNLLRQQTIDPQGIGTLRDADYIKWRYLDHPVFQYHLELVVDSENEQVRGLVVMRCESISPSGKNILRILECWGDEAAYLTLRQAIASYAQKHECAFIDAYGGSGLQHSIYQAIGLRAVNAESTPSFPCLFQPLIEGHKPLRGALFIPPAIAKNYPNLENNKIIITKSDGDQDRPS